jgi:hypothetical protein
MYPFVGSETATSLFELSCFFSTVVAVFLSHLLTPRM